MTRIGSVDVFRIIAILSVIVIHTAPFKSEVFNGSSGDDFLYYLFNQLARFAVPFFFIISGYFWGVKIRSGSPVVNLSVNMSKRIFIILSAWCLIYLLPLNLGAFYEFGLLGPMKDTYWNIIYLMNNPLDLLFQGTSVHLWYLISTLNAIFIACILIYFNQIKLLVFLSILLYIFGVVANAYVGTPLGIKFEFDTRNGPFFSTLFFVLGYLISGKIVSRSWLIKGFLVFIFGCLLHASEAYCLWENYNITPVHDYVFGTLFMGLGVALMALSNHPYLNNKYLGSIGRFTLGIYAVHYLFVDIFHPLGALFDLPCWDGVYILLVFVFSWAVVTTFSKNKKLKKIVM